MAEENRLQLVSIVIPVFNEQESLPQLLRRTTAACQQLPCPYEIILVDDGSRDNSAQMMTDAAQQPASRVVAVILNRNYGQHAAVMAGFGVARGDVVITLDADLQNPPETIPQLFATAQQGYDVVGSIRQIRQDSRLRKLGSRLVNLMVRRATGQQMSDYGCMLRAYRRPIVDAMLQCREHSTFIPILANSFARHTIELPVPHAEREYGTSRYGLLRLLNLAFDLITSMTTSPLRLLSLLGCLSAGCGFLLGVALLILRFVLGEIWAAQGVFTLFAVLFIFLGAQFLGMGLLGEYIGRIYTDVRARPRYFIQKIVRNTSPPEQGAPP